MDNLTSRLKDWGELKLADLVFAYRKAKVDCFFERSISVAEDFANYEANLLQRLTALLKRLQSPKERRALTADIGLLGTLHLVAKKLDTKVKKVDAKQASTSTGHAFFSSKARAFGRLAATHDLTAEFRITSRFPVDFHVLSALWMNRIGHRFDACLGSQAYGSRVRRYGDDGAPNERNYHVRAPGTMAPYFLPYRTWRDDGLKAIERALKEEPQRKVAAITLDIRNYFHRIDPRFIANPTFHESIGLGKDDDTIEERRRTGLTPVEIEFTELLVAVLSAWEQRTVKFIRTHSPKTDQANPRDFCGGIPIGVTASRLIANVLLCEWDREVVRAVAPLHYGRYVDDMFLVIQDPGDLTGPNELMQWIGERLDSSKRGAGLRSADEDVRRIELGAYQGRSVLELQDSKHRVFFLEGAAGLDLLSVVRREIDDLSSERRLMPDPDRLTRSVAAEVLTAVGDVKEHADSLRKAGGLSVRRLGWAIQLRQAETLALNLRPADPEWRRLRNEFYRFATDHVIRPESLLEHMDYLPRLLGIAVSCRDWKKAVALLRAAKQSLKDVRRYCAQQKIGVRLNGQEVAADSGGLWDAINKSFEQFAQDAVLRAWPWNDGRAAPEDPGEAASSLLKEVGIEKEVLDVAVRRVAGSDLARTPFHELVEQHGLDIFAVLKRQDERELASCFGDQAEVLRRFLRDTIGKRMPRLHTGTSKQESLIPYLFPTRPWSPRKIAELDPACVGLETNITPLKALHHWGKVVRAIRGIWTRVDSECIQDVEAKKDSQIHVVPIAIADRGREPRLCLANLKVEESSWHAAADGTPDLSLTRYKRIVRLVNIALKAQPKPDYLLLPELSIPRRWIDSIVNRLLPSRISLIAGVDYVPEAKGVVSNNVVLALTDDRLGFPSSVLVWQPKSAPAPVEEEELRRLHGKRLERTAQDKPRIVYQHHGFEFGVLICSELQEIRYRAAFQGEVDTLMILAWNKDLETFSSLVESAALDVHAYIALVNNRSFGDSRVRSPAKESFLRDLCRVRGGEDDYAVVVRLDVQKLREFQSRAKNWPRRDDPFKPVPQGFRPAKRRRSTPGMVKGHTGHQAKDVDDDGS